MDFIMSMKVLFVITALMMVSYAKNDDESCKLCECKKTGDALNLACENLSYKDLKTVLLHFETSQSKVTELMIKNSSLLNKNKGLSPYLTLFGNLETLVISNTDLTFEKISEVVGFAGHLNTLKLHNAFTAEHLDESIWNKPVDNLKVMEINGAEVKSISDKFFKNTPNLKELYLENNKFTSVPADALSSLKKLEKISMYDNPIKEISDSSVEKMKNNQKDLKTLTINSLRCDCDSYSSNLRKWLVKNDVKKVACGEPAGVNGDLKIIKEKELCGNGGSNSLSTMSSTILALVIASLVYLR